jgi:ATP-binding cassette subfamily B protein
MTNQLTVLAQLGYLWRLLSARKKKKFCFMASLMIVASFAEIVSIGAVLPFLSALTSPEKIFFLDIAQPFIRLLKIKSPEELLLPCTLIFIVAAILAGFTRITLLSFQTRLSMSIGEDLSVRVYERMLYQPYIVHVSRSSSEILAGAQKARELGNVVIQPTLIILSSLVILLAIIAALLTLQPIIAITAFLGFGLIYAGVVFATKRCIASNSQTIASQQIRVTRAVQEGLGGIRDVIIDSTHSLYANLYRDALAPMQRALASNQVVGGSPRFAVEALGMVLIAGLAYLLAVTNGPSGGLINGIPILGALALGAQRLLPVLQQIYSAYTSIRGNQASTQDVLDMLDYPMPEDAYEQLPKPMPYQSAIIIKDIGFRYTPQGPWVLRNFNLQIPRGSRVGFVGTTGSGKSTLMDIIMGLLPPTEGVLLIDDIALGPCNTRAWLANISHVPQQVYLSDTTIAENIAFGVPAGSIEMPRVRWAAEQAQISSTIEGWADHYNTMVGERGVRLSGGQRQRIGVARALYKRANVLVFDEATSALDNSTEAALIQAIESLGRDITILVIAHRLSTLKNCDQIVDLTHQDNN